MAVWVYVVGEDTAVLDDRENIICEIPIFLPVLEHEKHVIIYIGL